MDSIVHAQLYHQILGQLESFILVNMQGGGRLEGPIHAVNML